MAKLKTVVKPSSSDAPIVSEELIHIETELQSHRDETNARLEAFETSLKASFQALMDASLLSFQNILMERLQQQLNQLSIPNPESVPLPQADGSVCFGSIPPPVFLPPSLFDGSISSPAVRTEGNPTLTNTTQADVNINDVFASLAVSGVSIETISAPNSSIECANIPVNEKPANVVVSKLGNSASSFPGSVCQQGVSNPLLGVPNLRIDQYGGSNPILGLQGASSSILGQPPALGATQSVSLFHTNQLSHAHYPNPNDLFSMSYSGPYTASAINFGTIASQQSSQVMGSRLSNTNNFAPYFLSAEASYATTTTHIASTH